MTIVRGGRAV